MESVRRVWKTKVRNYKRKKLVDKKSQVCYIKTVIIIVIKNLKINYQIKKGENSYEKICM